MKKILALLLFTLTLSLFLSLSHTYGAGATLYLYPSSGTQYVDSYLPVYVYVNTGGNKTNAYKAVVTYPTDKLQVTSVSSGGSICSLWIPPSPSYSNNQGRAVFECGHPGSYNGSAGKVGVITFLVKDTGTATVRIADGSQVKKADGMGTEILAVKGSATFTLRQAPIGAPKISSPTHFDQNAWYQAKTAKLSWTTPSGVDGFSFSLSHSSGTAPDNVSEGTGTNKTYENLADGTWYFHLKAHSSGGWSATRHFRIQIDTQAPKEFEIISDPPADKIIDRAPTLSFATTDKPSGIDHYKISIDNGDFEKTASPYRFEWIYSGDHKIAVRAVDKAGNTREAKITLKVKYVPPPTITSPAKGEVLPLLEPLVIKGEAPEEGTVELYIDDQFLTRLEVNSLEFGHTYTEFLHPWEHKLSAVLVTEGMIKSIPAEVNFKVDPRAINLFGITLPGWLVYGLLVGIIFLLLTLLVRYLRGIRRFQKEVAEEVEKVKNSLNKGLDKEMQEDLIKKLDGIKNHPTRKENHLLQLLKKISLSKFR